MSAMLNNNKTVTTVAHLQQLLAYKKARLTNKTSRAIHKMYWRFTDIVDAKHIFCRTFIAGKLLQMGPLQW